MLRVGLTNNSNLATFSVTLKYRDCAMITYLEACDAITPEELRGFFVGWPNPPSAETHLKILQRAHKIVLAVDNDSRKVVGFVTAITDGFISAYIPLLEVLPSYQHRGIGQELMQRMLENFKDLYMVDLTCDTNLQDFYRQFGMRESTGMMIRNFDRQSCKPV